MEQNVEEAKKKGSKEKREGNLAAQEGANDQEQPSSDPLRVSD